MKINQLKQEVYRLTFTKNTQQLKSNRAELTTGKDLRCKNSWLSIYSTFKLVDDFQQSLVAQDAIAKHGFKLLNSDSSFADLLNNVGSLGSFCDSLESDINLLEKKYGEK